MKKEYVSPRMVCETFAADEYVAACGESGTTYYFKCNAPEGTLYYYPVPDGNIDGNYTGTGSAIRLGGYEPCEASHEAESTSAFYDGFVDYNKNRSYDPGEEVIVWTEKNWYGGIRDYHATKELNMNSWETAKS